MDQYTTLQIVSISDSRFFSLIGGNANRTVPTLPRFNLGLEILLFDRSNLFASGNPTATYGFNLGLEILLFDRLTSLLVATLLLLMVSISDSRFFSLIANQNILIW